METLIKSSTECRN